MQRLVLWLLVLCPCVAASQALDSAAIRGNWMRTDGSNLLHLSILANAACYDDKVWKIDGIDFTPTAAVVKLTRASEKTELSIVASGNGQIQLKSGRKSIKLKKGRTFDARFRPAPKNFKPMYQGASEATISGVFHDKDWKDRSFEQRYLVFRYRNELSNDYELAIADVDEHGRFETHITVYRPRICEVLVDNHSLGRALVQPNTPLVLSINADVTVDSKSPDYDALTQRFCTMGEDAAFNSSYLHFRQGLRLPEFPFDSLKEKQVAAKVAFLFRWHQELERKLVNDASVIYQPAATEQRFLDFICSEIHFMVGLHLLNNFRDHSSEPSSRRLKLDSVNLDSIRRNYLAAPREKDLLVNDFIEISKKFAYELIDSRTSGSYRLTIGPTKLDDRLSEYAPLLQPGFIETYRMLKDDMGKWSHAPSEEEALQRYFKGSREQANYFETMFQQIQQGLFDEVRDTVRYELIRRLVPDPYLRFVANLAVIDDYRADSPTPSTYRVGLFRRYSKDGAGPWRLVDSIRNARALLTGLGGLKAKARGDVLQYISNEEEWQALLKQHQGKTVVAWRFPSRFDDQSAYMLLHELQRLRDHYKDSSIVFLKVVSERNNSDRTAQLVSYIGAFQRTREWNDVYYVNSTVSLFGFARDLAGERFVIYNKNGQVHHLSLDGIFAREEKRRTYSLSAELDRVLSGGGTFLEPFAPWLLPQPKSRYDYKSANRWTLAFEHGKYLTFQYGEPKSPNRRADRIDSVFRQLAFNNRDSSATEGTLHLTRVKRQGITGGYEPERVEGEKYRYSYNKKSFALTMRDNSGVVRRRYRIVAISPEMLVLELLE